MSGESDKIPPPEPTPEPEAIDSASTAPDSGAEAVGAGRAGDGNGDGNGGDPPPREIPGRGGGFAWRGSRGMTAAAGTIPRPRPWRPRPSSSSNSTSNSMSASDSDAESESDSESGGGSRALTLRLPRGLLERAERLARRAGVDSIETYCLGLLVEAIEARGDVDVDGDGDRDGDEGDPAGRPPTHVEPTIPRTAAASAMAATAESIDRKAGKEAVMARDVSREDDEARRDPRAELGPESDARGDVDGNGNGNGKRERGLGGAGVDFDDDPDVGSDADAPIAVSIPIPPSPGDRNAKSVSVPIPGAAGASGPPPIRVVTREGEEIDDDAVWEEAAGGGIDLVSDFDPNDAIDVEVERGDADGYGAGDGIARSGADDSASALDVDVDMDAILGDGSGPDDEEGWLTIPHSRVFDDSGEGPAARARGRGIDGSEPPTKWPGEAEAAPMNESAAARIVLRHAAPGRDDPDALLATLRRAESLPPSLLRELVDALHVLEEELRGAPTIGRRLAFALHRLAFESQILVSEGWTAPPDELTWNGLRLVQESVDRVLSGEDIRY